MEEQTDGRTDEQLEERRTQRVLDQRTTWTKRLHIIIKITYITTQKKKRILLFYQHSSIMFII